MRIRPNKQILIFAGDPEQFRHQCQRHRAQDGTGERGEAADDDVDQDIHGIVEREHQRTDVAEICGVQATRQTGEETLIQ